MAAELTSSGVPQPAEEERNTAPDGKAYTWSEFLDLERRFAPDGNSYTWPEFLGFYGKGVAANYWNSADIHRAAEERSGASDGDADVRGGYETGSYSLEKNLRIAEFFSSDKSAPSAIVMFLISLM